MLDAIIALVALTAMEIVLGIDNIVFIAIISGRLPASQQRKARLVGLALALVMRVLLLLSIKWILGLTAPIFHLTDLGLNFEWISGDEHLNVVSWRDVILLGGGLFLIAKATFEIHEKIEGHESSHKAKAVSFASVLVQIALLDMVFSLDSVITAVGMADEIWIMVTAVTIAIVVMMIFSESISAFVQRRPTVKMLALSFLILIGVMLVAEGAGKEIEKGYIYFAMFFALAVEVLNLRVRGSRRGKPVEAVPTPEH